MPPTQASPFHSLIADIGPKLPAGVHILLQEPEQDRGVQLRLTQKWNIKFLMKPAHQLTKHPEEWPAELDDHWQQASFVRAIQPAIISVANALTQTEPPACQYTGHANHHNRYIPIVACPSAVGWTKWDWLRFEITQEGWRAKKTTANIPIDPRPLVKAIQTNIATQLDAARPREWQFENGKYPNKLQFPEPGKVISAWGNPVHGQRWRENRINDIQFHPNYPRDVS